MAALWGTLLVFALLGRHVDAFPWLWYQLLDTGSCAHPVDNGNQIAAHPGLPITSGTGATFVVKEATAGGAITDKVCPGKSYSIKVQVPQISSTDPHMFITTSQGSFTAISGDSMGPCVPDGYKRAAGAAGTTQTTVLNLNCSASGTVLVRISFNIFLETYRQASLNLTIDRGCAAASCPPPKPDCSQPCSCSYGVELKGSACSEANTTGDVRDLRTAMALSTPDFSASTGLYTNGRWAFLDDGVTPRTMAGFATAARTPEQLYWSAMAGAYGPSWLDDTLGGALRGDGLFSTACCGIRAEVAAAAARWYSLAVAMQAIDTGVCVAAGCGGEADGARGAKLILRGLAALAGADSDASGNSGPGGTGNPETLFKGSASAGLLFCLTTKKAPSSQFNTLTLAAISDLAASAAAGAGSAALAQKYRQLVSVQVGRFLQFSLESMQSASAAASAGVLKKAGACRSPVTNSVSCLRKGQQQAALVYFKAVAPLINSTFPTQAANILAAPNPLKTLASLYATYSSIFTATGQDPTTMLAKCKTA